MDYYEAVRVLDGSLASLCLLIVVLIFFQFLCLLLYRVATMRSDCSQGRDRKPQPPTRFIVGGPGEDHERSDP